MAVSLGVVRISSDGKDFDPTAFTCVICFELYNLPRKLPCSHSFCEDCLFRYVTEVHEKKEMHDGVKCPVCRRVIPGPENNQDLLEWVQCLEIDSEHAREMATFSLGEDIKLELCFSCKEAKIVTVATKFCMDCQETLCTTCADISHRLRALRDHTVINVSHEGNGSTRKEQDTTKMISQLLSCPRHPDKITTLICKDDENLYCLSCSLDDEMNIRNIVEVEAFVEKEEVEKEAEMLKSKLDKLAFLNEAMVAAKSITEAENKKTTENLLTEIRDMRARMNNVFDELENTIAEQCKALSKKHTIDALEDNAILKDTLTKIKDSLSVLERTKLLGSKTLLYVVMYQLKQKLKTYENVVLEMKSQYKKFDFRLEVHDTLLNSLATGPNETDTLANVSETSRDVFLPDYSDRFLLINCQIEPVSRSKIKVQDALLNPLYVGLVSMSDDRIVLLDNYNGVCCLVQNNDLTSSCMLTLEQNTTGRMARTHPCGISNFKNKMIVVSFQINANFIS